MRRPKKETWAYPLRSDQAIAADRLAEQGPTAVDKVLSALKGAAEFTGEWAKEQVHAAGQDLVSRVLLGESYVAPEQANEPEAKAPAERDDPGLDR